jgi:hypothetical protein
MFSIDLPKLATAGRKADSIMSAQQIAASNTISDWPARAVCTLSGSQFD